MIHVQRELHIAGPPGEAVYAHPIYASRNDNHLIESVRHEYHGPGVFCGHGYFRHSTDNGRSWTIDESSRWADDPATFGKQPRTFAPNLYLDPDNGRLILVQIVFDTEPAEDEFSFRSRTVTTRRNAYRISCDAGRTWTERRPVVCAGDEFDEAHWFPGVWRGRNGGAIVPNPALKMPDGAIVMGMDVSPLNDRGELYSPRDEYFVHVAFCRAKWNRDASDLTFDPGGTIFVTPDKTSSGACEPDLLSLGGQRLFTTMRCQGSYPRGIHSSRPCALSHDGGMTWSEPRPFTFDDGSPVFYPACYARFIEHAPTGKTFWIGNIQPQPVYGQIPRYPLTIAEFDRQRQCLRRDSVEVIQDLPPGAPRALERDGEVIDAGRRYTNFGSYVDRETGQIVLTMPEQPKTSWEDFTADCIRYRIDVT